MTESAALIKWTGSKRVLATRIARLFPQHHRYIEPFLGGGSVLFHGAHPGALAADVYEPLIGIWRMIRDRPMEVAREYARRWDELQFNWPERFYEIRRRFNSKGHPMDLLFLTRTCVNGIIRFNSRGHFNNSLHVSRRGIQPERFERVILAWSKRIQGVRFVSADFFDLVPNFRRGDFLYLDPPYLGSRDRFIANLDANRFFATLGELNRKGIKWALSFDGRRGKRSYGTILHPELYRRKIEITTGSSAIRRVLGAASETVQETLYLNYDN